MSKIYDGIMGVIVGDALGLPVEFRERDSFEITDMIGYGTFNMPEGTWSDDSSLTLATVQSIADCRGLNLENIMKNFSKWLYKGDFTPYGEAFDIGGATYRAINKYDRGCSIEECGGRRIRDNGNGSLMRIMPLTFVDCDGKMIEEVSALTHAHKIAKTACVVYVAVARSLLAGYSKSDAVKVGGAYAIGVSQLNEFKRIYYDLDKLTRSDIRSTGYVVDTLEAALWCLLKTNSYEECVLMAVNLGEDTDTVAAVAGGLAGILYGTGGKKGIPTRWINKIAKKNEIGGLIDRFEQAII